MNPARKNHQVYTRLTGLEKLVRINNCIEFLFKLQVAQLRASGVKRGKKITCRMLSKRWIPTVPLLQHKLQQGIKGIRNSSASVEVSPGAH